MWDSRLVGTHYAYVRSEKICLYFCEVICVGLKSSYDKVGVLGKYFNWYVGYVMEIYGYYLLCVFNFCLWVSYLGD